METRDRKKFWRVYSLFLLVATGGILLAGFWPHLFPSLYVSEVYKKYADDGHVAATFLRNFRVNDSVEVDVTLLEARDDEGWDRLQKDFNATPPPPEVIEILGKNLEMEIWLAPKNNYAFTMDSVLTNNDVVSVLYAKKQLCVFNIENEKQIDAVTIHQFEEGHTPIKNKSK